MKKTYAGVAIGLLLLLIGVGAFAYTPATTTAEFPVTEETRDGDAYLVTESLSLDGTVFTARTVAVDTTTGEERVVREFEDITHTEYFPGDGTVQTRVVTTNEEIFNSFVADHSDEEIIEQTELDGEYRLLLQSEADEGDMSTPTFPEPLIGNVLAGTDYEETGTTGPNGEYTVYEPREGWFWVESEQTTNRSVSYVPEATGELHIDSQGRLHHAHVDMEIGYVDTWGEYLRNRDKFSPVSVEITVDEPTTVRPEWALGADTTSSP